MFYVYIIYSNKLRKHYIGYSSNLNGRLKKHNSGLSKFTSKGIPWKLIYYEVFLSSVDARSEEKFLKSGKGRDRLKFLLKDTNEIIGRVA
ncbi:MAG: GIY-YIG nuclease family protein [Patescibacteria group bacterium]|nr:GIY-YIG nuclease family protein [Patescibacteria group bacterium]MDD4304041.1 GIY-YIG nuclease family protein [Patescibacteria group bacterium]MDD4694918.1 GIY-YIG nuclease family protein [Patescibacteria group bacterium]